MTTTSRVGTRLRPPSWRRWATAGIVAATALFSTALVTAVAGASGTPPQINVVTGSAGTKTVSVGHPQTAATAKLSAGYVAYNPKNGDEAVAVWTGAGKAHVYLIAGADEANEYHIATAVTATTKDFIYGTLVQGMAYQLAGSGTAGMVGYPGGGTTPTSGKSPNVGAVTNPIAPVSLAFDNSGNLLIAEALPAGTPTQTAIQVVAKAACAKTCAYGYGATTYPALVAGGLYTIAASGFPGVSTTPHISFTFQVNGFGLAVDSEGNIIEGGSGLVVFLNEQTTTVVRYGKHLPAHAATAIAGTTKGTATCGSGAVNVPATGHASGNSSPNLQWPHPFIDSAGNVYVNDDRVVASKGCTWVLPAATGSLDGMTVTAGRLYSLTGAATTTAATNGAVADTTSFPNTVAAATDAAGNVVVALSGTTPAVRVIAESTGTYYDQAMTDGRVYTICGGGSTTTTPTTCTKFKLPGAARPTTPPAYGLTSLIPGAIGDLLVTDGSSATTGSLYEVTGGPTGATVGEPTISSVTPNSGFIAGGIRVTIHGTNLAKTTAVKFGTVSASTLVVTGTAVTVTNPPHLQGTVPVSVTTLGGSSTKTDAFTYITPVPELTSVTPASGTKTGGTLVTLHGSNLASTSAVDFGTVEATTVVAATSTVSAVTPAHAAGAVAVTVTTTGGTAKETTAFTYITAVLPGSPTGLTAARAGSGAVTITWKAAAPNGSPITSYTATNTRTAKSCSTSGTLFCTISGLTNGLTYAFTVRATSGAGTGPASDPIHLVPATIPGAPGTPTAVRGVASATVRWTAPTPTPGKIAITKYTVTSTPTGKTCTWSGTSTYLCKVTTLKNGTSYTFKVKATNAVGTGPTSTASNVAVPEAQPPSSPTNVTAVVGNGSANVKWTPPATTGGSPVTAYTVTSTPTGKTCTTTGALTCSVTGLTNGHAYTFTVTATNAIGTSPTSQASKPVTPSATATNTTSPGSPSGTTRPTQGYTEVASDGGVFNYGTAGFYGSKGGQPLNAAVVGIAAAPTGKGYWEVAADGGIFNYGTAAFYGSKGGQPLNAAVVGIAAAPTGKGYWEVAADGGIFNYGTAGFYGSKGGQPLNAPIVGIAAAPTGKGYWEVAADGGIFSYGTAGFYGSRGGQPLNAAVVGIAAAPTGNGYWEVAADGGIFDYGSAGFYGSKGGQPLNAAVVGIGASPTGKGYWEVAADGGIFNYGSATFYGSKGGQHLNAPIVGVASTLQEAAT